MTTESETQTGWTEITKELRAFVRNRVRDVHAAEDLEQDVLVRLAHQLAVHGEPAHLGAWVFQTARNAVIDHYRTRKEVAELPGAVAEPEGDDRDPSDLARLHASFRTFVHGLPPKYREALLLTEYEGLTQTQLAARLGIPVSTAKSRVQRARAGLRKALTDCCAFEIDRRGGVIDWRRRSRAACAGCD